MLGRSARKSENRLLLETVLAIFLILIQKSASGGLRFYTVQKDMLRRISARIERQSVAFGVREKGVPALAGDLGLSQHSLAA